jgi:uncharacterized protein (TIGR03437 family)
VLLISAVGAGNAVLVNVSMTIQPPGPTLTSITPSSGAQGASIPITLTGTNFSSATTVNVANPGVAVSGVSVLPTQIYATFTIATGASAGPTNVTVTTSGSTSNAVVFTITGGPLLAVVLGGAPLGSGTVKLFYSNSQSGNSQLTGSPQLIQVRSTEPARFSVAAASGLSSGVSSTLIPPFFGSFLVYALVSPTATTCPSATSTSATYISTPSVTSTPVGICIAAQSPNPPLPPGYYPGALTLTELGDPVTVEVDLTVDGGGYLHLTSPYPTPVNTASFPSVSAASPIQIHVNVVRNTSLDLDNNDEDDTLMVAIQSADMQTSAAWIKETLVQVNNPQMPTTRSPAILNLSVDPMSFPTGAQTASGTVLVVSESPYQGSDYVRLTASLSQSPAPQFLPASSAMLFTPGTPTSQTLLVGSTGTPITFSVAVESDCQPWLTASPMSGSTGQNITVTVNPSMVIATPATCIVMISDSQNANTTLPLAVNYTMQGLNITGVANEASFAHSFAPGMLMTVFGTGLSNGTAQTVATAPLPLTAASGTSVNIDQFAAPLLYISATQINLQIPYEMPMGPHSLTVQYNGQSASMQFSVQAAAPGIYVDPQNHIVPNGTVPAGSTIALYATGAGLATPSEPTGGVPAAGTTPYPNLPLTLSVGGVSVTPVYAGIPSWSVGELQINFTVPSTPGTYPVVVTVGGIPSPPAMLTVTH